jgi:DNA-binding CsgD family transcriptional regulator
MEFPDAAGPELHPRVQMALEIGELVATSTDHYDEMLDVAARVICRVMGDVCVIGLLSDDRGRIHPLGLHHRDPEIDSDLNGNGPVRWDPGDVPTKRPPATGPPSLIPADEAKGELRDRLWVRTFMRRLGMDSAVYAAMRASGAHSGIVALGRDAAAPPFEGEDLPYVQSVADRLALVVENVRLKEEVERLRRVERQTLPDPRLAELTPREIEVLRLIGEGLTNRDIGERIFISVRTVEWHRARIAAKLDAHTRSALIAHGRALVD